MKPNMKKYPLLICLIISCVIVISSVFVLAFCGLKLGTSLGGGSQFEVAIEDSVETKTCVQAIKNVLKSKGLTVDSCTIEDKFLEDSEIGGAGAFTQKCVIVKILATNISDEKELEIQNAVAEKLEISVSKISKIDNIVSSIKSSDVLLFGLGIGAFALCLFVFGFVRYDVFAGLSFILAVIHNLILFMSIIILTRIPLNLVSISAIALLTLAMSALLISVYEKNKLESEMHLTEKETPSSRLIRCEFEAIKPYGFVAGAVLVFAILLFFVPVVNVTFSTLSIILALLVSVYTSILVGPAVYSAFLDIKYANVQATLSRNDTINKVIKKKVEKNTKK